ncbi:hypothetical protein [Salinarchaeum sp. Harcht-Bsk1]|uniref:hypothetical protein n=1 Tax=Salinarchaeum sp. Harcht-Bsk1 TaxID=1333523 RepID=UPI001181BA47|nr:hypothetical protein [Salinarchaeum sp. Harcht-Bsk1]
MTGGQAPQQGSQHQGIGQSGQQPASQSPQQGYQQLQQGQPRQQPSQYPQESQQQMGRQSGQLQTQRYGRQRAQPTGVGSQPSQIGQQGTAGFAQQSQQPGAAQQYGGQQMAGGGTGMESMQPFLEQANDVAQRFAELGQAFQQAQLAPIASWLQATGMLQPTTGTERTGGFGQPKTGQWAQQS